MTTWFSTVGKPRPKASVPCFVLNMFINLIAQLLEVIHKVHYSIFSQVDMCPFLCLSSSFCIHFCVSLLSLFGCFSATSSCAEYEVPSLVASPTALCLFLPFSFLPLLPPHLYLCYQCFFVKAVVFSKKHKQNLNRKSAQLVSQHNS